MNEMLHVLVRVWMPDRPGALGLVASRIGAVRGDIAGVDVLETGDGVVVDEFAVNLPDESLVQAMVREIEQVDGATVEQIRVVHNFPDARLDALDTATRLCDSTGVDELHDALVETLRDEFLADWAALVAGDQLLAAAGEAPAANVVAVLAAGANASPMVASGETGPEDLAIASLARHGAVVLVGRDGQPFRRRERAQLLALARIADRAWALLLRNGAPTPG